MPTSHPSLWIVVLSATLSQCSEPDARGVREAPPAMMPTDSTIMTVELAGRDIFAPGSAVFREGGRAAVQRASTNIPRGATLRVEVFGLDRRKMHPHQRPAVARALSEKRAEVIASGLRAAKGGWTVAEVLGRGSDAVGGREADLRVVISVVAVNAQ